MVVDTLCPEHEDGLQLCVRRFSELSVSELYDILKLRVKVFVVEQQCPYLETDDLDREAVHVFLHDDGNILAYLRVMDRGVESEYVSIGRVVTGKRGCGLGRRIIAEGIRVAEECFGADRIYVEAQTYVRGFYERFGFKQTSEEFHIDGIPHIKMIRG